MRIDTKNETMQLYENRYNVTKHLFENRYNKFNQASI